MLEKYKKDIEVQELKASSKISSSIRATAFLVLAGCTPQNGNENSSIEEESELTAYQIEQVNSGSSYIQCDREILATILETDFSVPTNEEPIPEITRNSYSLEVEPVFILNSQECFSLDQKVVINFIGPSVEEGNNPNIVYNSDKTLTLSEGLDYIFHLEHSLIDTPILIESFEIFVKSENKPQDIKMGYGIEYPLRIFEKFTGIWSVSSEVIGGINGGEILPEYKISSLEKLDIVSLYLSAKFFKNGEEGKIEVIDQPVSGQNSQ